MRSARAIFTHLRGALMRQVSVGCKSSNLHIQASNSSMQLRDFGIVHSLLLTCAF
jgi:hypothetical protein